MRKLLAHDLEVSIAGLIDHIRKRFNRHESFEKLGVEFFKELNLKLDQHVDDHITSKEIKRFLKINSEAHFVVEFGLDDQALTVNIRGNQDKGWQPYEEWLAQHACDACKKGSRCSLCKFSYVVKNVQTANHYELRPMRRKFADVFDMVAIGCLQPKMTKFKHKEYSNFTAFVGEDGHFPSNKKVLLHDIDADLSEEWVKKALEKASEKVSGQNKQPLRLKWVHGRWRIAFPLSSLTVVAKWNAEGYPHSGTAGEEWLQALKDVRSEKGTEEREVQPLDSNASNTTVTFEHLIVEPLEGRCIPFEIFRKVFQNRYGWISTGPGQKEFLKTFKEQLEQAQQKRRYQCSSAGWDGSVDMAEDKKGNKPQNLTKGAPGDKKPRKAQDAGQQEPRKRAKGSDGKRGGERGGGQTGKTRDKRGGGGRGRPKKGGDPDGEDSGSELSSQDEDEDEDEDEDTDDEERNRGRAARTDKFPRLGDMPKYAGKYLKDSGGGGSSVAGTWRPSQPRHPTAHDFTPLHTLPEPARPPPAPHVISVTMRFQAGQPVTARVRLWTRDLEALPTAVASVCTVVAGRTACNVHVPPPADICDPATGVSAAVVMLVVSQRQWDQGKAVYARVLGCGPWWCVAVAEDALLPEACNLAHRRLLCLKLAWALRSVGKTGCAWEQWVQLDDNLLCARDCVDDDAVPLRALLSTLQRAQQTADGRAFPLVTVTEQDRSGVRGGARRRNYGREGVVKLAISSGKITAVGLRVLQSIHARFGAAGFDALFPCAPVQEDFFFQTMTGQLALASATPEDGIAQEHLPRRIYGFERWPGERNLAEKNKEASGWGNVRSWTDKSVVRVSGCGGCEVSARLCELQERGEEARVLMLEWCKRMERKQAEGVTEKAKRKADGNGDKGRGKRRKKADSHDSEDAMDTDQASPARSDHDPGVDERPAAQKPTTDQSLTKRSCGESTASVAGDQASTAAVDADPMKELEELVTEAEALRDRLSQERAQAEGAGPKLSEPQPRPALDGHVARRELVRALRLGVDDVCKLSKQISSDGDRAYLQTIRCLLVLLDSKQTAGSPQALRIRSRFLAVTSEADCSVCSVWDMLDECRKDKDVALSYLKHKMLEEMTSLWDPKVFKRLFEGSKHGRTVEDEPVGEQARQASEKMLNMLLDVLEHYGKEMQRHHGEEMSEEEKRTWLEEVEEFLRKLQKKMTDALKDRDWSAWKPFDKKGMEQILGRVGRLVSDWLIWRPQTSTEVQYVVVGLCAAVAKTAETVGEKSRVHTQTAAECLSVLLSDVSTEPGSRQRNIRAELENCLPESSKMGLQVRCTDFCLSRILEHCRNKSDIAAWYLEHGLLETLLPLWITRDFDVKFEVLHLDKHHGPLSLQASIDAFEKLLGVLEHYGKEMPMEAKRTCFQKVRQFLKDVDDFSNLITNGRQAIPKRVRALHRMWIVSNPPTGKQFETVVKALGEAVKDCVDCVQKAGASSKKAAECLSVLLSSEVQPQSTSSKQIRSQLEDCLLDKGIRCSVVCVADVLQHCRPFKVAEGYIINKLLETLLPLWISPALNELYRQGNQERKRASEVLVQVLGLLERLRKLPNVVHLRQHVQPFLDGIFDVADSSQILSAELKERMQVLRSCKAWAKKPLSPMARQRGRSSTGAGRGSKGVGGRAGSQASGVDQASAPGSRQSTGRDGLVAKRGQGLGRR